MPDRFEEACQKAISCLPDANSANAKWSQASIHHSGSLREAVQRSAQEIMGRVGLMQKATELLEHGKLAFGRAKVLRVFRSDAFEASGMWVVPDVRLTSPDSGARVQRPEDFDYTDTATGLWRPPAILRHMNVSVYNRDIGALPEVNDVLVRCVLSGHEAKVAAMREKCVAHWSKVEAEAGASVRNYRDRYSDKDRATFRNRMTSAMKESKTLIGEDSEFLLRLMNCDQGEVDVLMKFAARNRAYVPMVSAEDVSEAVNELRVQEVMKS